MLTKEERYILSLLRESLKTENNKSDTYSDKKAVGKTIVENGILLTVFQSLPNELQKGLYNKYNAAIKQAIIQEYEGMRVLRELSEAGMNCIALKGWELRKLYPEPTMRQMADLDILVRPYDFQKIKTIMDGLGYSSGKECTWMHDNFRKNEITIEMHKRLTDDSAVIQTWERGLWDRASIIDERIHAMSPEDYYIFHLVHLHKDFMNGALGLRRIADTWLLQKQPMNLEVVKVFLETFGMLEFHERMVKLSRVTMGEDPLDEDSEVMLHHAFKFGIYGSDRSYKTGRIVSMGRDIRSGKLRSGLNAVFLPYKRMKAQFPAIESGQFYFHFLTEMHCALLKRRYEEKSLYVGLQPNRRSRFQRNEAFLQSWRYINNSKDNEKALNRTYCLIRDIDEIETYSGNLVKKI